MKNKYEIGEKVKLINVTLVSKQTQEEVTLLDDKFYGILKSRDLEEEYHINVYAVTSQVSYYRPIGGDKRRYFGKVLKMCSSYFSLNQNEDFANAPSDLKFTIDPSVIHPDNVWQPRGLEESLLPNVIFLTRDYFSFFVSKMTQVSPANTKLIVDLASTKFDEVHSPSNQFDTLSEEEKQAEVRDFTYMAINTINDALYKQKETILLRARLFCYKPLKMPDEIKDTFLDVMSIYLKHSCQPALSRGRYIADDIVYHNSEAKEKHTYFLNAVFFLDKEKFTSFEDIEETIVKSWIGAVGYTRQEFVDVLEKGWLTVDHRLLSETSERILTATYDDYNFCIEKALPFLLNGTDKVKQISYTHQYTNEQLINRNSWDVEVEPNRPKSINGWDNEKNYL